MHLIHEKCSAVPTFFEYNSNPVTHLKCSMSVTHCMHCFTMAHGMFQRTGSHQDTLDTGIRFITEKSVLCASTSNARQCTWQLQKAFQKRSLIASLCWVLGGQMCPPCSTVDMAYLLWIGSHTNVFFTS